MVTNEIKKLKKKLGGGGDISENGFVSVYFPEWLPELPKLPKRPKRPIEHAPKKIENFFQLNGKGEFLTDAR